MKKSVVHPFLFSLAAGAALGLGIKLFALDVLRINGTSMEPALHEGDLVLENKLAYGLVRPFGDSLVVSWNAPRPGEIIIYLYENRTVVKRCAAIQGMGLEYSPDSGYTLRAGEQTYPLTEEQYHRLHSISRVPDGYVMAIGDNAATSIDSRSYGFIPVRNVIGRVHSK